MHVCSRAHPAARHNLCSRYPCTPRNSQHRNSSSCLLLLAHQSCLYHPAAPAAACAHHPPCTPCTPAGPEVQQYGHTRVGDGQPISDVVGGKIHVRGAASDLHPQHQQHDQLVDDIHPDDQKDLLHDGTTYAHGGHRCAGTAFRTQHGDCIALAALSFQPCSAGQSVILDTRARALPFPCAALCCLIKALTPAGFPAALPANASPVAA